MYLHMHTHTLTPAMSNTNLSAPVQAPSPRTNHTDTDVCWGGSFWRVREWEGERKREMKDGHKDYRSSSLYIYILSYSHQNYVIIYPYIHIYIHTHIFFLVWVHACVCVINDEPDASVPWLDSILNDWRLIFWSSDHHGNKSDNHK